MKRPLLRALQGAAVACGAPLGWMAIQGFAGVDPLADVVRQPGLYAYLLFATMAVFAAFGAYVGSHEQEYEEHALHDALTGLYNLRYFRRRLREDMAAALRLHFPLSLLELDLDHFKRINDTHGHAVGDTVLAGVARVLAERQRESDTAARIGGEEFAVLLPFTDAVEAVAVAERLRKEVSELRFHAPSGEPFAVTTSVGVAEYRSDAAERPDALMRRVDQALYAAKAQGRDRVVNGDPG